MAIGWAEIQQWDPANLNTTSQNEAYSQLLATGF